MRSTGRASKRSAIGAAIGTKLVVMLALSAACGGNGGGDGDAVIEGTAVLPAQLGGAPVSNAPCEVADLQASTAGDVVMARTTSDENGFFSLESDRTALGEVRCTTSVEQVQGGPLKMRGLVIPGDPNMPPGEGPIAIVKNVNAATTLAALAGLGALNAPEAQAGVSQSRSDGSTGQKVAKLTAADFDQERIDNLEEAAARRVPDTDFTNQDSMNANAAQASSQTGGGNNPPPVCGNGIREAGEQCDGGSRCDNKCRRIPDPEPEPTAAPETGSCGSLCCFGQDDTCSSDSGCFCDEACADPERDDCCADFTPPC